MQIDDGAYDVWSLQIVVDEATVYAMWWTSGINIYFNRSLDNGAHWMDSDHRVNVSDGDNSDPVFAVDGSTIYVFGDRYNSGEKINFNHSDDDDVSWDAKDTKMPFGASPQMALANGVLHLSNMQNNSLYYRQYTSESGWKDPTVVRSYDLKGFDVPLLVTNDSLVFLDWHLRPYVKQVIYRYLDCGILHNGFARVKCRECGHEYLLAFSCKRRHFCPSCHQKRVVEFGEWLRSLPMVAYLRRSPQGRSAQAGHLPKRIYHQ